MHLVKIQASPLPYSALQTRLRPYPLRNVEDGLTGLTRKCSNRSKHAGFIAPAVHLHAVHAGNYLRLKKRWLSSACRTPYSITGHVIRTAVRRHPCTWPRAPALWKGVMRYREAVHAYCQARWRKPRDRALVGASYERFRATVGSFSAVLDRVLALVTL